MLSAGPAANRQGLSVILSDWGGNSKSEVKIMSVHDGHRQRLKDRFRQFTHKSDPASSVDQPMT